MLAFLGRRTFVLTLASTLAVAATSAAQAAPPSAPAPLITEVPTTSAATAPAKPRPPRRPRPHPKSPISAVASAPTLLWKTLIRRAEGAPVPSGDGVVVASGGQIQGIDSGGHTVWATDIGPTAATPAVDDTRIYVGTNRGVVYGVRRTNGKTLWKWANGATDTILTIPAVGAGRVYVESSDNNVYGLAAATGGRIWTFTRPDGSLGYSSPVFLRGDDPALAAGAAGGGGDALFVCGDTTVYRLDPSSGKEVWHTYVGGRSLSTPAVAGGKIFVGGDGGAGLAAFTAGDGRPLWTFAGNVPRDWFGAPVVGKNVVYAGTEAGRWAYAVDAATGKAKWSARLPGGALAGPVLDEKRNALYFVCDGPQSLVALDARTGAKLWATKTAGPVTGVPALSTDGARLYVAGTENGYLYCFGLK